MTTVTDLRTELDRCANLAPSDDEIRRALAGRITGRAKRRRTTALVAAAAAVVVVAGGAGIAGVVLSHGSSGPASPTPVVQVPEVPLPPDTKLIRLALQPVSSPVTAVPPKGLSGQAWFSAPGRLAVSFFNPAGAGQPASASGTDDTATATAGYTITHRREEKLQLFGPNGPSTPTIEHAQITINGHVATLDTAPDGTDDSFGFPARQRISWQLPDGRWIHVWTSGLGDNGALQQFAAGITDQPQTLDRTIGIGLTLPGLTVDSSMNSWPAVAYLGASVYLCPPGVDPMAPSSSNSTGSGSSGPAGSGTGSSTETSTNQEPTARCLTAAVTNIPKSQLGDLAATHTVTVGDTVAHVDTTLGAAWADLGDGLTAVAGSPRNVHLSAADLAALVASVRLSPAVTVLPPQPLQGQAHSQGGVASAEAPSMSAAPSPHAKTPALSALPTAPTTIASTPPSPGSLVAPTALPAELPFGFRPTGRGWYSSWSITPGAASGEATVMQDDGAAGGLIRWSKAGPSGIPTDASTTTVAGHPARHWFTQGQNGTMAHLAWTLPDGSGLELSSEANSEQDAATRQVTAFAKTITDGSISVPSIALPDRTIPGFVEPRVAFTVGPGTPTAQGDGSSQSGPATSATGAGAVVSVELCPRDTDPSVGGGTQGCLLVGQVEADTAVHAAGYATVGSDWQVATVQDQTIYVSPDGGSVARLGSSGQPAIADYVTVGSGVSVDTADLIAILLSMPG
jgi:hypothetical protein